MTARVLALLAVISTGACGYNSMGYSTGGSTGYDSVTVSSNTFTPHTVYPDPSGVVTWTWNSGGVTHNVTFEGAITGSGDKSTGTFAHTFLTPGTYRFRCTIHSTSFSSGMTGAVVVPSTGGGGGYAPNSPEGDR